MTDLVRSLRLDRGRTFRALARGVRARLTPCRVTHGFFVLSC
jgi:hypothetical protein